MRPQVSSFNKPYCSLNPIHERSQRVHHRFTHQFVFEALPLDEELDRGGARGATGATGAQAAAAPSTVGAAAVLRPADLIDGDAAEASARQGEPPAAGVVPSHDHCSHARITVTVEEEQQHGSERVRERTTIRERYTE